ncbi:hypothetical protein NEMBOFW57_003110 [Staphylotrichum longicolle]|uniref:Uncharacterized protein n=1 Tax=Staphylotrichum longicolle TaxID=669026 RepID=A0AAD4F5D0_9PEZI|nr:hypothetical protein NEMBOFW57_003110 [Staphylotrichum longicolle]
MLSEAPFRSYPLLTPEEFHEVCHHLDRRYCHATLGPARRRWKLRVCTALNTSGPAAAAFALGPEYSTYLQIVRPLEGELDDGDLSACLDNFSFGDGGGVDGEVEMEVDGGGERDREMMEAEEADRAPCLWFSLHDLPADEQEQALHVDTVFRRLVPEQYKEGLRSSVGGIGGISVDSFECSKENYLMVWLGLVGGCVGLWVPAEMALES